MTTSTSTIQTDCEDFSDAMTSVSEICRLQVEAYHGDMSEIPWLISTLKFGQIRTIFEANEDRLSIILDECRHGNFESVQPIYFDEMMIDAPQPKAQPGQTEANPSNSNF